MSIPNTERRVYALRGYTVELRARGWYLWDTYSPGDVKGPYSSTTSVCLMVARQLLRELKRRDAPHQLPN